MVSNVLNMYTKRINSDNRDKDYKVKMQSTLEMLKDTLSSETLSSTASDDLSGTTSTDYILIPKWKENSLNNHNKVSEIAVSLEVNDCVELESSVTTSAKFKKSFKRVPNSRELYVMIKKPHSKLYRFSDPQDLLPTFLTTAWDSKVFYCVKFDEYP